MRAAERYVRVVPFVFQHFEIVFPVLNLYSRRSGGVKQELTVIKLRRKEIIDT